MTDQIVFNLDPFTFFISLTLVKGETLNAF